MFKKLIKALILFLIGFFIYMGIEIAFRGYTYIAMGVAGGIIFLGIGAINDDLSWDLPVWIQGLIGSAYITLFELVFGLLLKYLDQPKMWDYSSIPFNFKGVICLPFSILWIGLSLIAIFLDDFLRWKLFGEEKPHYKWH